MKNFRGWEKVFSFTYIQNLKSKSYQAVSVIIAVLILGLATVLSVLAAKPEEPENLPGTGEEDAVYYCAAEEVLVLDLTGEFGLDFEAMLPELADEYYQYVSFQKVSDVTKEELPLMAATTGDCAMGIVIEKNGTEITVEAVVPSTSNLALADGLEIAGLVASCVEKERMQMSGLKEFQVAQLEKQISLSVSDAGETESVLVYLIQYLAPAVFGLVLYFLLLFYGQNINREVSTEKTSKLMETLLTSLHPYGLLTGKVFAVVAIALQQFLLWVAAGVLGLIGGSVIAGVLYEETNQSLQIMIEFLRVNIGESAFSPASVVLALVTFCCGFLFYCVLSGMSGSMVGRPEDAANTQSIFVMPIVISWLVCYMGTLTENEPLLMVARNIPFTIPFCVPADLLTGAIGIGQGILSTLLLLVFSGLVIMLSGRIYKGMVLYTGQKINWKSIIGILRNKESI